METGALGKKIFFLYPPPVLKEIVEELARREFEIYLVRDHQKLVRVLEKEPDAIVFINIDDGMKEESWESYIRGLLTNEATKTVGIGILSLNEDRDLMQKYLMDIQVPCGFVLVKIGVAKTTEILVRTLEANEARGRRKFVRALCPPGAAQCVIDIDGKEVRGELSDLSCAGTAIKFDQATSLRPGSVLKKLQLSVKGTFVIADGFVAAKRDDGENPTLIVMFSPASLDDVKKDKLRSIISKLNQSSMDRLVDSL